MNRRCTSTDLKREDAVVEIYEREDAVVEVFGGECSVGY